MVVAAIISFNDKIVTKKACNAVLIDIGTVYIERIVACVFMRHASTERIVRIKAYVFVIIATGSTCLL